MLLLLQQLSARAVEEDAAGRCYGLLGAAAAWWVGRRRRSTGSSTASNTASKRSAGIASAATPASAARGARAMGSAYQTSGTMVPLSTTPKLSASTLSNMSNMSKTTAATAAKIRLLLVERGRWRCWSDINASVH